MPPAETVLREAAAKHGWAIRVMPALPHEEGYIQLRGGLRDRIILRAVLPREPDPGYDPWDALIQSMCLLTDPA